MHTVYPLPSDLVEGSVGAMVYSATPWAYRRCRQHNGGGGAARCGRPVGPLLRQWQPKGECVTTEISPPIDHQAPPSQTDKIRELQVALDKDPLYKFLGIRIEEVGDGKAKVSVELTPEVLTSGEVGGRHVNGSALNVMAGVAAGFVAYEA